MQKNPQLAGCTWGLVVNITPSLHPFFNKVQVVNTACRNTMKSICWNLRFLFRTSAPSRTSSTVSSKEMLARSDPTPTSLEVSCSMSTIQPAKKINAEVSHEGCDSKVWLASMYTNDKPHRKMHHPGGWWSMLRGLLLKIFRLCSASYLDLKVASKSTMMSRCLVETRGRAKWCLLHRNRESTHSIDFVCETTTKKNSHMTYILEWSLLSCSVVRTPKRPHFHVHKRTNSGARPKPAC